MLKKLSQHLSTKDNGRNVFQDLLTINNTDLDFKVRVLQYMCTWASWADQNLISETFANSPKKQKQSETTKNKFRLWFSIDWETHKLTRYRIIEFSYIPFLCRWNAKGTCATSARKDYSFTALNWSLVFDPEKLTFSICSWHKTTYRNADSKTYGPCHRLWLVIMIKYNDSNACTDYYDV